MSNAIKNIILDMDGTILDHVPPCFDHNRSYKAIPIARPYLHLFMKYLFENFDRVSIWTAASKSWYDECYEKVIKPSLPEGKGFHFIKTRDDYDYIRRVKPLQMVYEEYPELYNAENTLIIDDNSYTFLENIDQAIQIRSFYYDRLEKSIRENLDKNDFELYNMIQVLHIRKNADSPPFIQSFLEEEQIIFQKMWIPSEEDEVIIQEELDALYNSVSSVEDW